MDDLDLPPCPMCGGMLRLDMRLEATHGAVSGTSLKIAARHWPYLACADCEFTERGQQ